MASTRRSSSTRGFTLVEIVVSLMIFSIVAVVALGALVKIVSANKKAQTLQASISNINFALDALSREMRVGTTYHCESNPVINYTGETLAAQSCQESSSASDVVIVFKSNKTAPDAVGGVCALAYAYLFKVGTAGFDIQKATQTDCDTPISANNFSSILDPQVVVTSFFVDVSLVTSQRPFAKALIRISGYAGLKEKEKTIFDIQTAVSPRVAE